MNSNQANESDGSYHIRVNPLPKKTKGQNQSQLKIKKEVKIEQKAKTEK